MRVISVAAVVIARNAQRDDVGHEGDVHRAIIMLEIIVAGLCGDVALDDAERRVARLDHDDTGGRAAAV